jgi:RNA polymerase sigma factor (TIGR02999 family)
MVLLYRELQRLARRQLLGQRRGHTLRTSDLVNETYLKLANVDSPDWKDRAHFLSVASRAMRSVLVDYARKRSYAKRGGDALRVSLTEGCIFTVQPSTEVIAVDQALARLSKFAPRKSQVVELRYFAGFSIEETAEVMALSTITVKREWSMARAWLRRELEQRNAP